MSGKPERTVLSTPVGGAGEFSAAFDVSRETLNRLAAYEALLRQWQKAVNLVAPSTLDSVWHRHFADSAQLLALAPSARNWIDLGSGAGFPGMVIAVLVAGRESSAEAPRPQIRTPPRIVLIESNARKVSFLREVLRQSGISASVTVDILSTRIETAATQDRLRGPDVISARALAPLDKLLALAAPLFASSTVGLFLKGRDVAAELKAAERLWNFSADLVPSRTEADGRVVVVRNLQPKHEGITS